MYYNQKYSKAIKFIKENSETYEANKKKSINKYISIEPLTGEESKQFYQDTLLLPSQKKQILETSATSVCSNKISRAHQVYFKNSDLLKLAENNDIVSLNKYFSQKLDDFDINITDAFGWTPLMCASYSGAEEAVKLLLEKGANAEKCDGKGNTPLKLAKQRKLKHIIRVLETFDYSMVSQDKEITKTLSVPFYCNLCKSSFKTIKKDHETSVVHLMNCKYKETTYYGISETNKGFQLLIKKGWNKGNGLGPHGGGRKFPITIKKRKNRHGIGLCENLTKDLMFVQKKQFK